MRFKTVKILAAAGAVAASGLLLQLSAAAQTTDLTQPSSSPDAVASASVSGSAPDASQSVTDVADPVSSSASASAASLPASAVTEAASSPAQSATTEPAAPVQSSAARVLAAVACTPSDVSSSISQVTLTDSSDTGTDVHAYESLSLNFVGALPAGGCAGDYLKITLPPELSAFNGSYPVNDPAGVLMGTMVVADGVITVTFNDYLETHTNVNYSGFISVRALPVLLPGRDYNLEFQVGATVVTIPVTTQPCPDCNAPATWPGKWANYYNDDPDYISFGLTSAVTQTAGESVVITDNLDSGQALQCDTISVQVGDSKDAWGNIEWDGPAAGATVNCDAAAGTVTISVASTAAGQYFLLSGRATVTASQTQYSDRGTITQAGKTEPVSAVAYQSSGGAGGNGETPTPTVTQSVSQSASSSVTTSSSTSASASQSGSGTPSSSTPASSNPASSTPTTTLPQTGTDASLTGALAGLALVAAGAGALVIANRRRR